MAFSQWLCVIHVFCLWFNLRAFGSLQHLPLVSNSFLLLSKPDWSVKTAFLKFVLETSEISTDNNHFVDYHDP